MKRLRAWITAIFRRRRRAREWRVVRAEGRFRKSDRPSRRRGAFRKAGETHKCACCEGEKDAMRRSLGSNWHLTPLVAGMLLATMAGAASAQGADGNWWEAIPGFGRPSDQPRRTSDED